MRNARPKSSVATSREKNIYDCQDVLRNERLIFWTSSALYARFASIEDNLANLMEREQRIEPRQAIEETASPPEPSTTRPDIPLTTIYTPPPSCNSIVTYDGTTLWQYGISQIGDPACYPPRFTEIYGSWYTPGICPQSWKSVGQVSHSPGHSDAMCCPKLVLLTLILLRPQLTIAPP